MGNRLVTSVQNMLGKIFKDRDVIVRSEGHVRYYTVSRRAQIWLSVPCGFFMLWLLLANIGIFYQQDQLDKADGKMQLVQHEYLALLQDLADYQKATVQSQKGGQAIQTEQQMSAFLLKESLLGKIEELRQNSSFLDIDSPGAIAFLDRISADLALSEAEYQKIGAYKTILSQKIDALTDDVARADQATSHMQNALKKAERSLADSVKKNGSLTQEISQLEDKLQEGARQIAEGNDRALSLTSDIKKLQLSLADIRQEKDQIIENKQASDQRANRISEALEQSQSHAAIVEQQLEIVETALHNTLRERGELTSVKRQLQQEIEQKSQQITAITDFQQAITEDVARRTEKAIDLITTPIKMTGLSPNKFLERVTEKKSGMGGPFISALNDLDMPGEYQEAVHRLDARLKKLNGLEKLARILPLHEPVLDYRVTSRFGRRKDPINGKWASHKGLDMVAKSKTPIYAPSPGIVVYAGTLGRFGRFVEIDHGKGIKTRYGHLNKILVRKGQKIGFRKKIALMGNSGRSTGTHLHYEIMIDGKQVNPEPFIKAGRYVFKK